MWDLRVVYLKTQEKLYQDQDFQSRFSGDSVAIVLCYAVYMFSREEIYQENIVKPLFTYAQHDSSVSHMVVISLGTHAFSAKTQISSVLA